MTDDLRLVEPCFVRVLRVLREVRDGITEVGNGAAAVARISEIIDIDFISRQAEAGAYDWDSCRNLVAGIVQVLQWVQAPARDADTRARWANVDAVMRQAEDNHAEQPGALCQALSFLVQRVSLLRIDAANARCGGVLLLLFHHHSIGYRLIIIIAKHYITDVLQPSALRLRLIAPVVRDYGIEYERDKFSNKLNSGALTVERTSVSVVDCLL